MTIREFLEEIIRVFKKAGVESPEAEARQLACHVLSCSPAFLLSHADDEVDDKLLLASAALINERCKGRPLQYVLGSANFYGIDLAVDERVLIPRPETELLAEEAIEFLRKGGARTSDALRDAAKALGAEPQVRAMDLCTGSGAIAAAVAANVPNARVVATELSPRAFMLARVNLRPYENVKVLRGDLFGALAEDDPPFDAILTNPPYIPTDVIPTLSREVKDHEPLMALDGGADGLDIIRRIIKEAPEHLKSGGILLMETGHDQGAAVVELAAQTGAYQEARIIKDLAGRDRILRAVRQF
ncbi:MAG: peptide chain release factor N(5)-glutamine methyltransferase [Firmicutes bacterium]|nr:peptide chain release factor N(5)-glutamine methyltransferase [Bacillota bacterium]